MFESLKAAGYEAWGFKVATANKAPRFHQYFRRMNSTWLRTSVLANQRARKALFTCVVYINGCYSVIPGDENQDFKRK